MSKDQWAYWRAALNGLQMDFDKDDVPSGFYEHRNGSIIAIWRDDGGIFCWKTNATQYAPKTKEKVCEYFAYCTGNPSGRAISHDEYLHIMAGGKALAGPRSATIDKPATIGDNSAGMTDDERISAEIKDLSEQFNSWLEKIGKIATQEQADKAANYAEEFSKLEKDATKAHKTEKDPFLEGGRAVDAKWKPIAGKADEGKRAAKSAITPFLVEQDRLRREAEAKQRELEAAQRKAEAEAAMAGAPPPPAPEPAYVPPVRTSAGSGRKTALKTYKVTEVTDLPALAAHLAAMDTPPVEFIEACQKAAARLLTAGATVPGATQRDEKRAA